jgi:hypothetical protein
MNNLTSAFSLYEVLRIILPGFYTSIMLKHIIFNVVYKSPAYSDQVDGLVLFVVLSVLLGGLLYSMDIPRWFRRLYSTLPSNLIEQSLRTNKSPVVQDSRYYENEFFKFYYKMDADAKFKTEIQSGLFHLFVTMSFVGLFFTLVYFTICACDPLSCEYRILNISVFLVCMFSAIIMYKQKLKYSWKRNYELYEAESQKTN